MKALVTGGCGFIGSNLAVALAERGHKVVVLDDMYLGTPDNLEPMRDEIAVVDGDVRDRETVSACCDGVDTVFHNAARSSAPMHVDDPVEGVEVNVNGFINVMEEARDNGFRVVYASTSSMYGSVEPPHSENMGEEPINLYSASKMSREMYAAAYHNAYGVDVVGLRYFSVYGPRERSKGQYANLISQFMWAMMEGERPEIWGDGTRTRDFTFVEDIARGNIAAAASDVSGEAINLGTGTATTLNDMVALLQDEIGTGIKPEHVDPPRDLPVSGQRADISKARELLDWEPEVDLETGIQRTVEFYRRR